MSAEMPVNTFIAPHIAVGSGAADLVGREVARLGVQRVLVVTDPGVRADGLLVLPGSPGGRRAGLGPDQVESNPTTDNVDDGLTLLREHGCGVLVAMGGGSAIDCAKRIALLAANGDAVRVRTLIARQRIIQKAIT